ncbi:MAG: histidinol-phosphate aminotransferase family protein [Myxococcales bacterium]|nr:histidinol-phosphate aminotransferase family protein [Myxococcales bacterium]
MASSRAHVAVVPDSTDNDVVDLAAIREAHAARDAAPRLPRYAPTTSLDKILRSQQPPAAVHKLDWNEGTIAPPPSVGAAMVAHITAADGAFLKWYPQLSGGEALQQELASYCGVGTDNLLITNGSDDALILLCHGLLGAGKTALAPTPTYEHFCVNVVGTGADLIRFDLDDPFVADPEVLAAGIAYHQPTLVYLVSPNNPTGIQWSADEVGALAVRFPDITFVVDEAYHEFGSIDPRTGRPMTCAPLAMAMRNVVVTRTFSKAFCLASVRCGYVIAHPATLDELRPFYNPKSVNQLAQVAATAALREFDAYYRPYVEATHAARDAFVRDLEGLGIDVRTGGAGNFVCVRVPDGRTGELCKRLEAEHIYVRDIGARFHGYVRITIGLEMDRVVDAVHRALLAIAPWSPPPGGAWSSGRAAPGASRWRAR